MSLRPPVDRGVAASSHLEPHRGGACRAAASPPLGRLDPGLPEGGCARWSSRPQHLIRPRMAARWPASPRTLPGAKA